MVSTGSDTTATGPSAPSAPSGSSGSSGFDRQRSADFLEVLKGAYQSSMLVLMVDLGRRLGLFDALRAAGPSTSVELAARTGLSERHLREWLAAVAVGGVLAFDGADGRFELPAEHAVWLTGTAHTNLAPMAGLITGLAPRLEDVEESFRHGGGVPYERYRPHFTCSMDAVGRAKYDAMLVPVYLRLAPGIVERLEAGVDVVDVGCGTGHCLNLMAQAFPASRFLGVDFSGEALALARAEAAAMGLGNARFEEVDLSVPDALGVGRFDVVFAFDAIHDQSDPAGVLERVRHALRPGGVFLMLDIKASSHLAENLGDRTNLLLYGTSVMHCMQVSLAGGGPGLGTVWGTELATGMLAEAGFPDVTIHDLPGDPTNCLYVCPTG